MGIFTVKLYGNVSSTVQTQGQGCRHSIFVLYFRYGTAVYTVSEVY